jgi:hypothetical protein
MTGPSGRRSVDPRSRNSLFARFFAAAGNGPNKHPVTVTSWAPNLAPYVRVDKIVPSQGTVLVAGSFLKSLGG